MMVQSSSPFKVLSPSEMVKIAKLRQGSTDVVDLFQSYEYTTLATFNPVYLNLYSDEDFAGMVELHIENSEGDVMTIQVKTIFEDNSDRLTTLLNNNGVRVSDIWYKALKSSDLSEMNYIVLNRKRREFLLSLLELTGCVSGYNGLFAALDYFEWSDVITVKEYWQDGQFGKYRITDVNETIIDRKLLQDGFIKTGWLGLYFAMNEPDGTFDDDGFANFTDVTLGIEDAWTKLYYLKQILEENFLGGDVKIIDIVGEFTGVAGIDTDVWVDKACITSIRPNPINPFSDFSINTNSKDRITIQDDFCLRKMPIFKTSTGGIALDPSADSSHPKDIIFKIERSSEQIPDYEVKDLEVLTKFYRGDFATIRVGFNVNDEKQAEKYTYKIGLQLKVATGDYTEAYLSPLMSYGELLDSTVLGIRRVGDFRLCVYIFDGYGGMDMISSELNFTVSIDSLDIQLFELTDKIDKSLKYDIGFYTTIPTVKQELVVPDAFDLSFDIGDRTTAKAGRYYKNSMTERQLTTTINQYNMVEVRQLQKARSIDFSTYHEVLLFPLADDITEWQCKLYDRHEWNTIKRRTTTLGDKMHFVSMLNEMSHRNNGWKNPFNRYTYHLVKYSLDGTMTNTKDCVLAYSKQADRFFDRIIHNLEMIPLEKSYIRMLALQRAVMRIDKIYYPQNTKGMLTVTIGRTVTKIPDLTIGVMQQLEVQLRGIAGISSMIAPNGTLIISAKDDVMISHPSIGTHFEVVRNTAYDNIKKAKIGQDFQITVPVFGTPIRRHETYDYKWTVVDRYSGDIVHEENNEVLCWIPWQIGIYDVKLEMLDSLNNNTIIESYKRGGIRIADVPFDENTADDLIFYNKEVERTVFSELCDPTTSDPEPILYVVPARKYSSNLSQQDADNMAMKELNDNAQEWANSFGQCVVKQP